MDRKEFLSKISLGAAFVLTVGCFGGCGETDGDSITPAGDVNFELDLNDPNNAALLQNGGYIVRNNVVVAKDDSGRFVAATVICSHDGRKEVILKNNEWFCTAHDARFRLNGQGLNDKGKKNLTIYNTELQGSTLHIFS